MAITIPSAINLHTSDPDLDPLDLEKIGGSLRHYKFAGNLPITSNGPQCNNHITGTIQGTAYQFPTAFDATTDTKIVIWGWQFYNPDRIQVDSIANDGILGRLYSSLGNYLEFRIGGNDTQAGSSMMGNTHFILDPKAANYSKEVGTFDITNVSGYAWASKKKDLAGTGTTIVYFNRAFLFDTTKDGSLPKFTGTSNFDDIITEVLGTDYTNKIHTFVSKVGSTYTLLCPWQIGDNGTTATTFNDNGATVVSASDNDSHDPRIQISDQAMRVYISLGAADSVTLSGIYSWGSAADWDFNSNAGATVTLDGATFSNMGDFKIGPDVSVNGTTFKLASGKKVIDYGATLNQINVKGTLELTTVRDLTDVKATKLIITQGGTYTLTGCSIDEVENVSGSTVTLVSDVEIAIQTETSGSFATGSAITFNGIDSWVQFSSSIDRDINSNSVASGTGSTSLTFTYTAEITFYLKLTVGDEVLFKNITISEPGQTVVSLGTSSMLSSIQSSMNEDHAEIKASLNNSSSSGRYNWVFL